MIPIQRAKPFKVIHWDYYPFKSPVPVQIEVKENLKLLDYPIPAKVSQTDRGFFLEWRFKYLYLDGSVRLSYIAQDCFFVKDYINATEDYVQELLKQSYAVFNIEFNERKQTSDLRYNYLKPFENLGIQPKLVLTHLQEPFPERKEDDSPQPEVDPE
jgi:hypothetical protein